ncbi:hypothetical protein [Solimicrobium silvestre]|uniref:Uncharacterized protein n=1 Tax=Solimicrobium silvestre TaxID=2099400 RepID=A0A2S9GXX1_9BURK|nr:hypothetical protein [Solimicrobium silvestre]PRC92563.1 hypothetical protein S2091_2618 [Solimicrobium silvestre]
MTSQPRPYRSLYTYAWDVIDQGIATFVEDALSLGITDVSLATSYHAGKFIRPHAQRGPRVIFPEDGVVYFDPQLSHYGEIKPQAHSDPAMRRVLPDLLADARLRVHGWTVLLHNSRIGSAFPHYCTQNVFGDAYVYSLCPMQPAVFDYAVALSADLAGQHAVQSLILETPGWLPYAHGYHHEFAQIEMTPNLDQALGLCFCSACKLAAKKQEINVEDLQLRLQNYISNYFNSDVNGGSEQIQTTDDLLSYVKMRQNRVTELVSKIREVIPATTQLAVIPTVQRPTANCWTEGSDLAALASVADYLEIPFYEPSAKQVLADAWDSLQRIGADNKVRGILRPGHPDLKPASEITAALEGLQQLGIRDIGFYNYGLLPRHQLNKLMQCLTNLKALS